MGISGALVKQYHPDDENIGVDKDGIALEVDGNYLREVDEIIAGIQDVEVINDQFRRCCAEILKLIEEERQNQGIRVYSKNQKIILLYEMYRTAKLYKDKVRKDGTSVFYSHLIGTVKNVICDLGLTGVVSLLAMLKHDMVEDFVDKDEVKNAGKKGAVKRVQELAKLLALKEKGDRRKDDVAVYEEALKKAVKDICAIGGEKLRKDEGGAKAREEEVDFAAIVTAVLENPSVPEWEGRGKVPKYVEDIVKDIRAAANVIFLINNTRDASDVDLQRARRNLAGLLKKTKTHFETFIDEASEAASGKYRRDEEKKLYEKLINLDMCKPLIEGYEDELAEAVVSEVRDLVSGLTKLRRRDRQKTLEATVAHHIGKIRGNPRAALLKAGGDRPHNTATIYGHKSERKRYDIMEETEVVYVPEADVLQMRRAVRRLVYDCVKFFNPNLLRRYDSCLRGRLRTRLQKEYKDAILESFTDAGDNVVDVKFLPRGIEYYTKRAPRTSFADMEFSDLNIDPIDPMFEVLVETKPDDITNSIMEELEVEIDSRRRARGKVLRRLTKTPKPEPDTDSGDKKDDKGKRGKVSSKKVVPVRPIDERLASLGELDYKELQQLADDLKDVIDKKLIVLHNKRLIAMRVAMAHIIEKFSANGDYDIEFSGAVRSGDDPNKMFGIILTIFNEKFGGQMQFRINDAHAEARSKRGVIAETGNIPDDLSDMIGAVLDKTISRTTGEKSVVKGLRLEVFAPRIRAYTMSGELVELPIGATGFDFASRIHGDVLIGAQKLRQKDAVSSRIPAREVRLWDELTPRKVYIVEACKPDSDKVQANLKWLLFMQSNAGNQLRRHFRKLPERQKIVGAKHYLRELAELYNMDKGYVAQVLMRDFWPKYLQRGERMEDDGVADKVWGRIFSAVGSGEINPVLSLAHDCEARMTDYRRNLRQTEKIFAKRTDRSNDEDAEIRKQLILLKGEYQNSGKLEVEVHVPEETGALNAFAAEFPEEAGISIYKLKEHAVGTPRKGRKLGKPAILKLVFDLENSKVSYYEFFRKLLKLTFRYEVKVVDKVQEKYDKQKIAKMRQRVPSEQLPLFKGRVRNGGGGRE